MKKFYIKMGYPCDKRILDSNKITNYLDKNGYLAVDKPKDADLIIFIPCGSNDFKVDLNLKLLKKLQKFKKEIIVGGCIPATDREKLKKIFNGKTFVTEDLDKNPEKIDKLFSDISVKFSEIKDSNIIKTSIKVNLIRKAIDYFSNIRIIKKTILKLYQHIFKNLYSNNPFIYDGFLKNPRWYLRVSWGCLGNCSYCAICKAVGKINSKPIDICIEEFKEGLKKGYKEFVITADNVGLYGIDNNSRYTELLDKITEIEGDYKIYLRTVDPFWIVKYSDELINILKRNKIIMIESPIQSGSQKILKKMNRYSDIDKIKSCFSKLKKMFPDIYFSTHVILSFPSEKLKDYNDTLSFIKDIKFDLIQIFSFSSKEGTKASNFEDKVDKKELKKRYKNVIKTLKNQNYTYYHPQYYTGPNTVLIKKNHI